MRCACGYAEIGEMEMLVRFVDAGGQHQLSPRVQSTGEWQAISVPVRGPGMTTGRRQ